MTDEQLKQYKQDLADSKYMFENISDRVFDEIKVIATFQHFITSIESLQKENKELLSSEIIVSYQNVILENAYLKQEKTVLEAEVESFLEENTSLITTIESQKEEMEKTHLEKLQWNSKAIEMAITRDKYFHELQSQKAITELAVNGLKECLIGGNSLASVLIGYNLPHNWQEWSIENASINFHTLYPLDPDMAYERYEVWLCWKTLHIHSDTLSEIERLSHE